MTRIALTFDSRRQMRNETNQRLVHDHAELNKRLGELIAALSTHDIRAIHARLDLFWAHLGVHIRAEHLHLFPAIVSALSEAGEDHAGDKPTLLQAQNAIAELRRDHDFFMHELSSAIAVMRELSTIAVQRVPEERLDDVRTRIIALADRLSVHNRLEENGVYLWTRTLLSEAGQSALVAGVIRELANMPPRFAQTPVTQPD